MPNGLVFDDRLLNRYTVENLEASHPTLHIALQAWFTRFGNFDDTSVSRILNARGAEEVDRWKESAQAAVDSIPGLVLTLDAVIGELEGALAAAGSDSLHRQLEGLRESARINRAVLLERVPALVAAASRSVEDYGMARQVAAATVEQAARRLEDMHRHSEDGAQPYRELQRLVTELQDVWAGLDRALASLSRQDQRAIREPHEARMRETAVALCRNLFARKTLERLAGTWPPPAVPQPGDTAPEAFAAALARGDYPQAARLLAPWLAQEWTSHRLAEAVDRSAQDIAAGFDLGEPPPAGAYSVSSNPMRFADVRRHRTSQGTVPREITADNFIGWFPMQIQPDEEDAFLTGVDYLTNLFVVSVRTPMGERIGYVEFGE